MNSRSQLGVTSTVAGLCALIAVGAVMATTNLSGGVRIGVTAVLVLALAGVMAVHGAARGFVVTSGRFTAEAEAFGKQCKVSLIDGVALAELIASTKRSRCCHTGRSPARR